MSNAERHASESSYDATVEATLRQIKDEFPWATESGVASHMTLLRAEAVYAATIGELYQGFGLSAPRFNLLWLLYRTENSRLTISDLAAYLGVTIPSILRMVQTLDNEGWLRTVRANSDRRVTFVDLTEVGRERFKKVLPQAVTVWEQLWSALDEDEKHHLNHILAKLRRSLLYRFIGEEGLAAFRNADRHGSAGDQSNQALLGK